MDLNQRIEQWFEKAQQEFHAAVSTHGSRRPHVTLSYAQSWDGSITTSPGETLVLSSETGKQLTHQLRSLHDGILVGIGTVLADNPQLNVREWSGKDPQPIVIDSQLRIPPTSKLCRNGGKRCWIVTTSSTAGAPADCEPIVVPGDAAGQVDLPATLEALYRRGIRSLMVEGGAAILTSFLQTRLADAIVLTVAPVLVGGYSAIGRLYLEEQVTGSKQPGKVVFPRISPLHSQQQGDELIVWGSLHYGD